MNSSAKTMTVASESSNPMPVLWVRTVAGPEIGFGHLNRCFTLARAIANCCTPLFLVDPGDQQTAQRVAEQGWEYDFRGLEAALNTRPNPAAILIDTRVTGGLDDFIGRAKSRGIPVVSIHDIGLAPVDSDIAIDGSIVSASARDFPRCSQLFSGTDFMILNPAFAAVRAKPRKIRAAIESVFINLGGGNSGKYFETVLKGLRLWGHPLNVVAAPGFVAWGQERLGSRNWEPLQFRWENKDLAQAVFESDLAITAGGISAYEALCAGTPVAALSHDHLQQRTITALAEKGACISLGPGDRLRPALVSEMLLSLNLDIEKRKSLSKRARGLVDGRGAERVSQIIQHLIDSISTAATGRMNASCACV